MLPYSQSTNYLVGTYLSWRKSTLYPDHLYSDTLCRSNLQTAYWVPICPGWNLPYIQITSIVLPYIQLPYKRSVVYQHTRWVRWLFTGLGWLGFEMFHSLPDSARTNENAAGFAGQHGKMVEHPNQNQTKPRSPITGPTQNLPLLHSICHQFGLLATYCNLSKTTYDVRCFAYENCDCLIAFHLPIEYVYKTDECAVAVSRSVNIAYKDWKKIHQVKYARDLVQSRYMENIPH